jgi:hypothetical protein
MMAFCFDTNAPVQITSIKYDTGFARWRKVCERFPLPGFFSRTSHALI